MKCNCPVCDGKEIERGGITLAEKEVIPFFKQELLNLKYPTHPFPFKYRGLLAPIMCYSQALHYNRLHSTHTLYYTKNEWLLKYSDALFKKFGMKTVHKSELKADAKLACEFNVR